MVAASAAPSAHSPPPDARAWSGWPRNSLGLAAVYSSPLGRAMATAQPIAAAAGVEPIYVDGLAELDFGAFEGRTFAEIAATDPALYERWMAEPTTVQFPGGESYADLKAR